MVAFPLSMARRLPHVTLAEMDSLSDCAKAPESVMRSSLSSSSEWMFSFSKMTAMPSSLSARV